MDGHSISQPATLEQLERARPLRPAYHAEDFSKGKARTLECLREAGPRGYTNEELRVRGCGERPSNRVKDLRDVGHLIETTRTRPARFVLLREADGTDHTEKPARQRSRHNTAQWFEREFGKPHPWKTPFSEKRLAQDDCFQLTPPEVRP